jgi:polyisoprenyl-teichoic acid--peptidoglycan teichoic acid transferase
LGTPVRTRSIFVILLESSSKEPTMKYTNVKIRSIKNGKKKSGWGIFLLILGLAGSAAFILFSKHDSAFSPISIASSVTAASVKETDGRTNILVLGMDKRADGSVITSDLTDTILVASIGRVDKDIVLISVPRDLWVQTAQGYHMKINSLYAYDKYQLNGNGIDTVLKSTEEVLGIPIHYYTTVNFQIFRDVVNILGGVEVNVDTAFTDYEYPVEGMEAASCGRSAEEVIKMTDEGKSYLAIWPCRYKTISFAAGPQKMDADTALAFARSRHGNNNEGTDFARAKRQQKIIMAVKDQMLSLKTLMNPEKLKGLYDAYSKNVETNIDLSTLQNFYLLSQQINFDKNVSIVLDERSEADQGGLLYSPQDPSSYGAGTQYILIPRAGDYSQMHAYVQKYLFGAK